MEVHDLVESKHKPVSDICDQVTSKGEVLAHTARQTVMESLTSGMAKWIVVAALFALCVAPTFISYQPYLFQWDDSEYLARSVAVSRAVWSGSVQGAIAGMVSIRPPAMTLLGVPWGMLESWDAVGNCFVTLAAVISLLSATCLYLLLRIGLKPLFLVIASLCVAASLGPFPPGNSVHTFAAGFLADSLFGWTALAAVLLIPYEARMHCPTIRGTIMRGVLWGTILSLGAMTKLNFLYFVALIVPVLLFIKSRHDGLRSALAAFVAFVCSSAPSAVYLFLWGKPAFDNMKAASFGGDSKFYYSPLLQFLGETIRESPGLLVSFLLIVAALAYLVIKRRVMQSMPDFLALLIMLGFGIIVFAATNKQIRYAFPAIVALPFLTAILMSGKGHSTTRRSAALASALAFCCLLAAGVPMRHRADRQRLSRCDAALTVARQCRARSILLATDSPTLNAPLMTVAAELSPSGVPAIGTLAYQAMAGAPIEDDFRALSNYDLIVFQDRPALSPPFTNQRVPEYESYVRRSALGPIRVGDDTSIYLIRW